LKFGSLPLSTPSLEGLSTVLTCSTQNAKVYFESLPKPLLEVQIGVQRLVLRARHKNVAGSKVFTNAVPTSRSSAKVYSCEV